ncbi:IucA/IucC family C-terminal-domain containing protein [Paenibacillus lactis]|uniref:IucA/IucC family C-terminal-domain containing protein n=1 Tax=Paenibacillus lactis TaxID=228574 RepID=UPI0011A49815
MNRPIPLNAEETATLQAQYGLRATALSADRYDVTPASKLIRASTLLEFDSCNAFLDELGSRLGTDSRPIAASMLAKRYAAVVSVPFFHALTCFDKELDLSLESVLLRSGEGHGSHWLEGITIDGPLGATTYAESRESWRLQAAENFVRFHLTLLWQSLSRSSGLPAAILWENTAVRIFSLYEKKLPKSNAASAAKIADDLRFLLHTLPAKAFGQRQQPFARFYVGNDKCQAVQEQKPGSSRSRLTCCLYYRVSREGGYCDACPKAGRRSQCKETDAE